VPYKSNNKEVKMKIVLYVSIVCASALFAAEAELGTIDVEADVDTKVIEDVSGEDIQSADVADALFQQTSNVYLQRRSGIANDIIVRGQIKDNINVLVDGTKTYGACPNRMDPPISHLLTNNIDYIEIKEGPFDVENFGTLSALVNVYTLKPEKELHGDLNLNLGSWGYQKASLVLTGGAGDFRFLLSASGEQSGQYEDGDGNDFVGQIQKNIDEGKVSKLAQYQPQYQDMDAYTKKTMMAKLFWDIADNQELRLSYTANRSDDVLYPSSKMDAIYDDSNIYNAEYIAKDLGAYSKELYVQAYHSDVEHPMSTVYRMSSAVDSNPKMPGIQTKEMTHKLNTDMDGGKIRNTMVFGNHTVKIGLEYSLRNWDGGYYKNGAPFPEKKFHSIWDVDTENYGVFLSDTWKLNQWVVELGLRYDDTSITSANPAQQDNDYSEPTGYILATYHADDHMKYFAGFGRSSRVPDAKELYWIGSMGNPIGTPDLENTINDEFDVGVELQYENNTFKAKAFYSMLGDYIAYNDSRKRKIEMMGELVPVVWNAYENVDATVYGIELSGTYIATESIYFDYGMTYQRGEKDHPLTGQVGTNMPDMPPLKFIAAVNYEYDATLNLRAEAVAATRWKDIDYENGEQVIPGYGIFNLKASKTFMDSIELTLGVDNVLDKTYAVSNTYKDLILLTVPGNEVMLLNEPGRYFYANLKYSF